MNKILIIVDRLKQVVLTLILFLSLYIFIISDNIYASVSAIFLFIFSIAYILIINKKNKSKIDNHLTRSSYIFDLIVFLIIVFYFCFGDDGLTKLFGGGHMIRSWIVLSYIIPISILLSFILSFVGVYKELKSK